MTTHTRLTELTSKQRLLMQRGKVAEAIAVSREIEQLKQTTIQVPVSEMMQSMTDEEQAEARRRMNRMFVYADLLDSAVTDFQAFLRKFDPSSEVIVCRQAKKVKGIISDVVATVDKVAGGCYSEHHAKLCDEVGVMVKNVLFKYEAKSK